MSFNVSDTFNPLNQDITILAPDGTTVASISIALIQEFQVMALDGAIGHGSQIGAAAVLLVCLVVTTRRDKRRSLVFILNALALLLVVVRGILSCLVYTGPFFNWYRYEMAYYADVKQAQEISICAAIMDYLLDLVVQLSLFLQVHIVCCTLDSFQRHLVNILNGFIAFLVLGARLGVLVLNINWNILGVEHQTVWQFHRLNRLAFATNILFVVSIGISTAIFTGKLALAIRRRRSMGMTKFGPMQIIFIMGCQTMCMPFIFTIFTSWGAANVRVQSFVPTVVALCLPLSALWATANANNVHIADAVPKDFGTRPVAGARPTSGKTYNGFASDMSDSLVSDDSTTSTKEKGFSRISQPDLEMQKPSDDVSGPMWSRTADQANK